MTPLRKSLPEKYGRWAIVTGASSGIGREIAKQLAASKFHLVLLDMNSQPLEQLAPQLANEHDVEVRTIIEDLSKYSAVELLHATEELDVGLLVCAAGFGSCGPFLEADLDHEVEMLRVNCEAVMTQAFHFGRRFAQRGRGGIVLLSSALSFHGAPYFTHYVATKAYVQSLAEALHVELAPHGIDVLASAPGPTKTGFAERAGMILDDAMSPELVARATLQSLGKKSTVIPGFISKLIAYGFTPAPRWAHIRIVGNVMKRRAKEKSDPSADSGHAS